MPIIWHIMKIYSAHQINEFVICLGYKGYVIKEFFANYQLHNADVCVDLARNTIEIERSGIEPWRITLVETGENTETGGRLKRIKKYVENDEAFCLTYGDGVADVDVTAQLRFHREHGKAATITGVRPRGRFGALELEGDAVGRFKEKPDEGEQWINGGFFVLSPSTLDLIEADKTIWEREPLETLAEREQLACYRHTSFWQCMDTLRDCETLRAMWAADQAPWKVW